MANLQKGDLVLVTGATGFLASHIANQLLQDGYRVRGTVRSLEKAKWLYDLFDKAYGAGKFEAVTVLDMNADGAFDEAVKGVDAVCHTASVVTLSDKREEVIPASVKGAVNAFTAATKEPKVKAFVFTSSSSAVLIPEPNTPLKVTEDSWNEKAIKLAYGDNPHFWSVYAASKVESEQAIWKAAKDLGAKFQVATVLPNANFGAILKPGGEESSSTASWAIQIFNGDESLKDAIVPQYFIDPRDTARLHVASLVDPQCNGRRIFGFASSFNLSEILAVYRKLAPGKNIMSDPPNDGQDLTEVPNQFAEELLRKHYNKGWTTMEEGLKENLATVM